jgi:hypothetical protein
MLANIIRNSKKSGIGGGGGGIVIDGGDPYYSAVSLMLSMDGTNGSTTFTDSSLNALTVTATGNAQISTTQSKYGGASGYFDGSGDYLDTSGTGIATAFGTGDFTIEFWYYPLTVSVQQNLVDKIGSASNAIYMSSAGVLKYYVGADRITGSTLSANTWYHIALVRYSGTTKLYVNGVQSGASYADTNNYALNTGSPRIGAAFNNTVSVNGYIDDLRISRFARYVSNFTPPTAALPTTASSTVADPYYNYTSLLLHMDGAEGGTSFTDNSANGLTVTSSSVTTTSTGAKSGFGQAGDFPGSSSSALTIPGSSVFNFGTGNFTIEFWFNIPAGASGSPYGKTFVSNENNVWSAGAFSLYALASSTQFRPSFWINEFSGSVPILIPSSGDYRDGSWHHFAIVRNGSAFAMYIDGSLAASGTHSGNCGSSTRNLMIGDNLANNGGDRNFLGKLDDLRITKYARYTSAFTPPASAFPNA